MAPYRISAAARNDLQGIRECISQDDSDAAVRVIQSILDRCSMLARQPMIGTDREDVSPGLRDITVGKYVIFHRVVEEGEAIVEIVRILHSARDIRQIF